jgi:glycerol-3-phosphate dehydrogenase (NAD(P)+)
MIAEGYYASRSIMEINKTYQADMPICETVYHILYENISPAVEVKLLSNRLK